MPTYYDHEDQLYIPDLTTTKYRRLTNAVNFAKLRRATAQDEVLNYDEFRRSGEYVPKQPTKRLRELESHAERINVSLKTASDEYEAAKLLCIAYCLYAGGKRPENPPTFPVTERSPMWRVAHYAFLILKFSAEPVGSALLSFGPLANTHAAGPIASAPSQRAPGVVIGCNVFGGLLLAGATAKSVFAKMPVAKWITRQNNPRAPETNTIFKEAADLRDETLEKIFSLMINFFGANMLAWDIVAFTTTGVLGIATLLATQRAKGSIKERLRDKQPFIDVLNNNGGLKDNPYEGFDYDLASEDFELRARSKEILKQATKESWKSLIFPVALAILTCLLGICSGLAHHAKDEDLFAYAQGNATPAIVPFLLMAKSTFEYVNLQPEISRSWILLEAHALRSERPGHYERVRNALLNRDNLRQVFKARKRLYDQLHVLLKRQRSIEGAIEVAVEESDIDFEANIEMIAEQILASFESQKGRRNLRRRHVFAADDNV